MLVHQVVFPKIHKISQPCVPWDDSYYSLLHRHLLQLILEASAQLGPSSVEYCATQLTYGRIYQTNKTSWIPCTIIAIISPPSLPHLHRCYAVLGWASQRSSAAHVHPGPSYSLCGTQLMEVDIDLYIASFTSIFFTISSWLGKGGRGIGTR